MQAYDPKYTLLVQKPNFPKTQEQIFEDMYLEQQAKIKSAARKQRIEGAMVLLTRMVKPLRYLNSPQYCLTH